MPKAASVFPDLPSHQTERKHKMVSLWSAVSRPYRELESRLSPGFCCYLELTPPPSQPPISCWSRYLGSFLGEVRGYLKSELALNLKSPPFTLMAGGSRFPFRIRPQALAFPKHDLMARHTAALCALQVGVCCCCCCCCE